MGSYLQSYGVEEERRGRLLKQVVIICTAVVIAGILGYLFFHNLPERQKAKSFLAKVNSRDYKAAYAEWGCTAQSPCPNYDFGRFMEDWAPKNVTGPWSVASTDSCATFLTVNVQAPGSELQSLAVQRNDHSLGYAPAPECQERKWRWKQFFGRFFGKSLRRLRQASSRNEERVSAHRRNPITQPFYALTGCMHPEFAAS